MIEHYQNNLSFQMMSLIFWFRDKLIPPLKVLQEAGIEQGDRVLDFGCGPGGFTIAAAELVGKNGKVFAADIHPMALKKVSRKSRRRKLDHVQTIHTDCETGIESESIDVVLFYDTLHSLDYPEKVLAELHRLLKTGGIMSFSDHHLGEDEIPESIAGNGLFELVQRTSETYIFKKCTI
ncbi:methyltransferase domain-containing protein [candidate division KSB1 bacterium]|nr:methyltransferase domain-containing protein [candidate division KSB1 bacterium]